MIAKFSLAGGCTRAFVILTIAFASSTTGEYHMEKELSCEMKPIADRPLETPNNFEGNTRMMNMCLDDYAKADIVKKCEHFDDPELGADSTLFVPVWNRENVGAVYWNQYCAKCNYDEDFEFGKPWSYVESDEHCRYKYEPIRSYRSNSKFELRSLMNESSLRCVFLNRLSPNSLKMVSPCLYRTWLIDITVASKSSCNYFSFRSGTCPANGFLSEGDGFSYLENGDVKVDIPWAEKVLSRNEYAPVKDVENVIFICGQSKFHIDSGNVMFFVGALLSTIFLKFYLMVNTNKAYLSEFPNRVLFSYSITLMMACSSEVRRISMKPNSLILEYLFFHVGLQYLSWHVLISFEYFLLTYYTFMKRRAPGGSRMVKYVIYCVIGFVIPLIVTVVLFFNGRKHEYDCPSVPGFASVYFGDRFEDKMFGFWEELEIPLRIFGSIFVIVLLLQIGWGISVIRLKHVESEGEKNQLLFYVKITYVASLYWIWQVCNIFITNHMILGSLKAIQYGLGVFIFFAFGFKKSMITNALNKVKNCNTRQVRRNSSREDGNVELRSVQKKPEL